MYTMAALVSTASALHFMVKVTLAFNFWLFVEGLAGKKTFTVIGTKGINDNVLVLHNMKCNAMHVLH